MIDQLPMPVEFQKLAIEGYPKHGRGFVRWVTGVHGCDLGKYHPAEDCDTFNSEPNTEHLKRLLQIYNPLVEFVLFVDFEYQGKRCLTTSRSASTHLYPRLLPLVKYPNLPYGAGDSGNPGNLHTRLAPLPCLNDKNTQQR